MRKNSRGTYSYKFKNEEKHIYKGMVSSARWDPNNKVLSLWVNTYTTLGPNEVIDQHMTRKYQQSKLSRLFNARISETIWVQSTTQSHKSKNLYWTCTEFYVVVEDMPEEYELCHAHDIMRHIIKS